MSDFESFARHLRADLLIFHGCWSDMNFRIEAGADAMEQMQGSFQEMQGSFQEIQGSFQEMQGSLRVVQQAVGEVQHTVGKVQHTVGKVQHTVGELQQSSALVQRAQVETRDILRQVVGHARQSGERMDAILGAMHREFPHTSDLEELRLRVEALERKLAS